MHQHVHQLLISLQHASRPSLVRRCRSDRGASLVEYALLIVLIALVCIVAVTFFGGETSSSFVRTGDSIART